MKMVMSQALKQSMKVQKVPHIAVVAVVAQLVKA
jgi:hypothetical protein